MLNLQNSQYKLLSKQLDSLLTNESNMVTNLSQFSALVFNSLNDLNWVGFYLVCSKDSLQLGPFQGRVACTKIPFGKGVCGAVSLTKKPLIVANVHEYEGHIACDAKSNSELVVPLVVEGQLVGVCDLDSPSFDRFSQADLIGIESLVEVLIKHTDFSPLEYFTC